FHGVLMSGQERPAFSPARQRARRFLSTGAASESRLLGQSHCTRYSPGLFTASGSTWDGLGGRRKLDSLERVPIPRRAAASLTASRTFQPPSMESAQVRYRSRCFQSLSSSRRV